MQGVSTSIDMLSSPNGASALEFIKLVRSHNDGAFFDDIQKQVMIDPIGTINSLKFDLCDPTNSISCSESHITAFTSEMELMLFNYDLERVLNTQLVFSDGASSRSTG